MKTWPARRWRSKSSRSVSTTAPRNAGTGGDAGRGIAPCIAAQISASVGMGHFAVAALGLGLAVVLTHLVPVHSHDHTPMFCRGTVMLSRVTFGPVGRSQEGGRTVGPDPE